MTDLWLILASRDEPMFSWQNTQLSKELILNLIFTHFVTNILLQKHIICFNVFSWISWEGVKYYFCSKKFCFVFVMLVFAPLSPGNCSVALVPCWLHALKLKNILPTEDDSAQKHRRLYSA